MAFADSYERLPTLLDYSQDVLGDGIGCAYWVNNGMASTISAPMQMNWWKQFPQTVAGNGTVAPSS